MNTLRTRLVFFAFAAFAIATPLFASRPFVINGDFASRLERGAAPGEKLVLEAGLIDGLPTKLELERFELWTPDAQIIVYEADGKSFHTIPRPATRFYKGTVNGDPESIASISVGKNGRIAGTLFVGERVYEIGRGIARTGVAANRARSEDDVTPIDRGAPLFIREFDPIEDLAARPDAQKWSCDVDKRGHSSMRVKPPSTLKPGEESAALIPVANGTPSTGVSYKLIIAIETDGELRAAFASDAAELTYLQDLMAKASTIYQRDLNTTLVVNTVHQWSNSATDPWTVTSASTTDVAIGEFGTYWHNNYSGVTRSSVVFMSGKAFYGGIAWYDTLCDADFFCGATGATCGDPVYANKYGGGYAFCGSTGSVSTTTPDPTATVNGVEYGMPTANYWPLVEVAHELGHNANGPHTHCIPLNVAQQTTYNVIGRTYVDLCASGECYVGATSAPAEKGTIMSYCHNFFPGSPPFYPQSRFRFYKSGEANELILGDTAAKCLEFGVTANPCYFTLGLNNATSTLNATITVGSNLSCSAGQTASVPANGSATFAWQITGGTITSSTTTNSITFTPNAATVTLTVTVTNSRGCSITYSQQTSTQCGAISAPTGVVATATSATAVSVQWNAVGGATSYTVYRSANNSTYSNVGTTSGTSISDATAAANTAYLYKVTATNGINTSGDSNKDLATTVIFTDPTLTSQSTKIKRLHVVELRTAVNAVRKLANSGSANDFSFTDPTITANSTKVKRIHIIDLRTAIDAPRSTLGLTALTYTDPTITQFSTKVKKQHVQDVRNGVI